MIYMHPILLTAMYRVLKVIDLTSPICIYVLYVCVLVCVTVYVCMYVCMDYMCVSYRCVCMYVCMHVGIYVYVCMYIYICMYILECVYDSTWVATVITNDYALSSSFEKIFNPVQ